MPELPEVETVKKGLQKAIVGKKIVEVKILREKSFKGSPREIIGRTVKSVGRRAKLLIIDLDDGVFLIIHLKMTGQLIYKLKIKNEKLKTKMGPYDVDGLPNKYTRVIIDFSDGSKLFFNDLRVFGWMKIIKNLKLKIKNDNAKLKINKTQKLDEIIGERFGPEALGKDFTVKYLKEILGNWGRPVKVLLMDQKKIAGIGNIYANEALFCAGIAPHHRGRDLLKDHPEKVTKLHGCIRKVLKDGIKYGGSTASDDAFRNVKGEKGKMQDHLRVYAKAGEDCLNKCGKKIRRMTLGGRGTFFCPKCQR